MFLYADDILLIAPSVNALQILLNACIDELSLFLLVTLLSCHLSTLLTLVRDKQSFFCIYMRVNENKSMRTRFGKRYNVLLSKNEPLKWVNQCQYLGLYFVSVLWSELQMFI